MLLLHAFMQSSAVHVGLFVLCFLVKNCVSDVLDLMPSFACAYVHEAVTQEHCQRTIVPFLDHFNYCTFHHMLAEPGFSRLRPLQPKCSPGLQL